MFQIIIRILIGILSAFVAAFIAALILPPDIILQLLFTLPMSLYLYRIFIRPVQRRAKVAPNAQYERIVDLTSILCGGGLIYFGMTVQSFLQLEGGFDPLPGPTLQLTSVVSGLVFLAVGITRRIRRKA